MPDYTDNMKLDNKAIKLNIYFFYFENVFYNLG